ncbi:MAG: N-acetylmuramoyl-L-alanine amidase [Balneola sp.]
MFNKNTLIRMFKIHSWCTFSFVLLCSLLALSSSLPAQNSLSRISTVDRSDGKGAVIRYHFSEAVDSFEVIQPAPDLVQMVLYGDIDTTGIKMPEYGEKVNQVILYEQDFGFGVDIYLGHDYAYKANAYPDQNQKHLLVGLTETDMEELDAYSQQFLAKTWYENFEFPETPTPSTIIDTGSVTDNYNPVRDKLKFDKIVIDAGHGGHDPGNLGYKKSAQEKDVVLSIAKKLGGYIEENLPDVEVIYTRETDEFVDLWERGSIANRAEADLFVSIHADGFTKSSVRGASVFFLGLGSTDRSFEVMKEENQIYAHHEVVQDLSEEDLIVYELAHSGNIANSERIAYLVEDQLKNRAQRKSRGVRQKGFVVLYQSTMPAILVETGFLTNPAEKRYLTSDWGQSLIASAIYRAIKQYKQEQDKSYSLKVTSAND